MNAWIVKQDIPTKGSLLVLKQIVTEHQSTCVPGAGLIQSPGSQGGEFK